MTKYTVVTSFHQPGLEQYGQRMIDSFESNWPKEVDLYVCAENCQPQSTRANTKIIDLLAENANLQTFIARHKNNPMAHALAGPPGIYNPKKAFRWNAVRFCYKVFSIAMVANQVPGGWLIWIDADSHTHSNVPVSGLAELCPEDSMISYLGRGEKYHSECGWVAYNLDHPHTRQFIRDFVEMYITDDIFKQREWHDSYIWDVVRRRYDHFNKFYNLNPSADNKGLAGHPFINSALGLYMDHVKGDRKNMGHSKSKEVIMHQNHPYWQKVMANPKGTI
jgi:hypothetical protein